MKEITYSYEVIDTNLSEKTFTVVYKCQGKEDVTVKIDYPFINDIDVDILIQRHSPVVQWINEERQRVPVELGVSGVITAHFPDYE